jgi:hypothetical protein
MNSSSLSFAKAWFALSALALAFGYGFASHAWGLFPKTLVERAWRQSYWFTKGYGFEKEFSHTKKFTSGARTPAPEAVQPGIKAITSWWTSPEGPEVGMRLIDREGKTLHKWILDRKKTFEGASSRKKPTRTDIQGSLLLSDGDVVVNLEYVGMARLDACGEVLWTLDEGNHHSISQAEDGSFWVPAVSDTHLSGTEKYPDLLGLREVWVDRILNVSAEGEVLRDIKVLDVLYENDLERFFFQHGRTKGDITHINDVEPLKSSMAEEYPQFEVGDLLVSLRRINLVFVFDPETMEVKWHVSDPFIWQHDPDFIRDGWIGVFDNNRIRGKTTGEGSRIIAFQPHTDSTKILFQGKYLDRFYTGHRGKWQMLGNGNMLLTEEAAGRVVEVSSDGKPVWEWVHESYDSKVPSVTKATHHDLTREEIASWPCSSVDSISASAQ